MKRSVFFVGFMLLLILVHPGAVFAQRKITIKLASLVPENTPWGTALTRMSQEWSRVTNGQVELRVYAGGVLGSEDDVIRKMRGGTIQGGVFTSFGIKLITPEILTLSVPFLIRNDEELAVVLRDLKTDLEAKINEKGYFTLAWCKSGWVKIFSKSPVFIPDDLKRQKVGTNPDTPELTQAFKTMGYQMVPVTINGTLIALNSGMIDAVYQSPVFVGGLQTFTIAKNMTSINLAPFMGAIILNQQAWRSIPDQYKPQLIAVSQRLAGEIDASISELENNMVKMMSTHGLVVNKISPEQEQLWHRDIEQVMPTLLGTTFDRDIYRKVEDILKTYRSKQ